MDDEYKADHALKRNPKSYEKKTGAICQLENTCSKPIIKTIDSGTECFQKQYLFQIYSFYHYSDFIGRCEYLVRITRNKYFSVQTFQKLIIHGCWINKKA